MFGHVVVGGDAQFNAAFAGLHGLALLAGLQLVGGLTARAFPQVKGHLGAAAIGAGAGVITGLGLTAGMGPARASGLTTLALGTCAVWLAGMLWRSHGEEIPTVPFAVGAAAVAVFATTYTASLAVDWGDLFGPRFVLAGGLAVVFGAVLALLDREAVRPTGMQFAGSGAIGVGIFAL